MKAIVLEAFGGPEKLKLAEVKAPEPEDDEVQIELAYTSVNPVDWKIREGYLKDKFPHEFPVIPGWDAAGRVSAVGKEVFAFKPGARVYAYCRKPVVRYGTYAEYVTMYQIAVAPMPSNLSYAEAATIPLTGLTAWQSLFDNAGLQSSQTVLIHAGSGGVGSLAIQFARHAGARRIYTTCGAANHPYVKDLGADTAIDYRSEDFVAVIKKTEPDGIDAVLDTIGGDTYQRSFEVLRKGGALVSIIEPVDAGLAERHGVRAGYTFVEPNGEQLREIADLIEAGTVRPATLQEMRLEDAAEAHKLSQSGHVRGKIVLKINDM